jgi:hypothetical protein
VCGVDATLRAARLLGRAGRWTEGIQLCESMQAPEAHLVATERFATLAREVADDGLRGWARFYHAVTLDVLYEDRHDEAKAELADVRKTAEPYLLSYVLRHLAFHELEGPTGDRGLGAELAWQSLTLRLACGAMPETAAQLEYLAEIWLSNGDAAGARRLAGPALAICDELGITGPIRAALDDVLAATAP